MTREDIIRMAREAGVIATKIDGLERFATLVEDAEAKRIHNEGMVTVGHMREQVLAEREACAAVCEAYTDNSDSDHESHGYTCAAAIRARSQS